MCAQHMRTVLLCPSSFMHVTLLILMTLSTDILRISLIKTVTYIRNAVRHYGRKTTCMSIHTLHMSAKKRRHLHSEELNPSGEEEFNKK